MLTPSALSLVVALPLALLVVLVQLMTAPLEMDVSTTLKDVVVLGLVYVIYLLTLPPPPPAPRAVLRRPEVLKAYDPLPSRLRPSPTPHWWRP
jgi:hypothetical protein